MAEMSQKVEESETINSCFVGKITIEKAREKFNKTVNEIKRIIAETKENKELSEKDSDELDGWVKEMSERAAYLDVFDNFGDWRRGKEYAEQRKKSEKA